MLREEDKDLPSGINRKNYLRSVSWTDRSPTKPNPRPQTNNKARSCLPPLQPLSISRPRVEEWPTAGSDDLGVWPLPPTPGARIGSSIMPLENSNSVSDQPPREFQFKKDKLAFFDKECSRIADHIYLGSDAVAKNREILRQNGITHVLNCVGFVCPEYFKSDLVYKTLWLRDSPSEDITSILYDVFDYFEDVREQGGRVLVHCCQGVSRSTSLVIAYLMWREGQSFEHAFHNVKAARGVTNPNMGFACQLLQCQKRVHSAPTSPNSVLRMYRMAPHSPYDPLHLVPKMLIHPIPQALDSRGAFIVHVPSAIYIWIGKECVEVMSDTARAAACQVIRYEKAQGPILTIKEGEETTEFWNVLANGQVSAEMKEEEMLSARNDLNISSRKVDEYDLDFDIFHKALSGGVVPPFPLPGTISETCLPARENGWGRLRRKFACGLMKDFITSAKLRCEDTQSSHGPDMTIDTHREVEDEVDYPVSPTNHFLSSSPQCNSPNPFSSFSTDNPDRISNTYREVECSVPLSEPSLPSTPPCGSPDSFSCFSSPKFSSKSPLMSPSTSDYSSSFTFSPSSSNWSDLSFVSSSPSGNTCMPCKAISPTIAERRGSYPPPRMVLPSADETSHQGPQNLVRSWSFSLPDLEDDLMRDVDEQDGFSDLSREESMLDAELFSAGSECRSGFEDTKDWDMFHLPSSDMTNKVAKVTNPILYQWPTLEKVKMHCFGNLDSRSVYIMLMPDVSFGANDCNVLYIWLGRDVLYEKENMQLINSNGSHVDLETVGRNFLNQMGLPLNSSVQIVREGEEPEQLLKHLNCFSFQEA